MKLLSAPELRFAAGLLLLSLIAFGFFLWSDEARECPAPVRGGRLVSFSGSVRAGHGQDRETATRRVATGEAIFTGETVHTGPGATADIRLNAGEVLSLGAGSALTLLPGPDCTAGDAVALHAGMLRAKGRTERVLWIEIGKQRFEFASGDVVFRARGEDETETRVYAGGLILQTGTDRKVIAAAQQARINDEFQLRGMALRPRFPRPGQLLYTANEKLELELRWQYHGPGTVFLDLGREPDFAKPLYSRETSDHRLELKLGTGLYHWRLRARDADGRLLETGETRSFRVLAVDPPRLVGPVGGERVELQGDRRPVDFHWRFARPGDTHFRVEVSRKRDFSEVARAKTTTNDTITLPLGEGRYWWRVIASGPDQSDGAASPPALFNLGTARQLARIGVTVRTPRGGRTIDPFNRGGIRFYWKASPVFDRFKIEMFHYNGRLGRRVFKLNTTRRDILFDRVARLKPGSYRWVVTAYQQDGLTMSDHGDFNIMLPPRPRPPVSSSPETQIQVAPSFDEPRGRRTPPDFSGAPRSRIAPPGESEAEIIRRIPSTGSDRP